MQNVRGDLTSLSSQAEEMRILGHCWPKTVLIVSKNDPLSVHIRWTPALCQLGPVLFTQHSVFLTVSPWSGSPQNEAVELPICQACLEEELPVQEVWETLIIHSPPEGILYPPERSY